LAEELAYRLLIYQGENAPILRLTGTWADYIQSKPSRFRGNLNRKEKHLTQEGTVGECWFTAPEDVPDLLEFMHTIEAKKLF
jgi:hypothetical protein